MTTSGNEPRTAPEVKIFHAPCAFNPKGVSEATCAATTRVISRNAGCCSIECTSKVRACKACLLEGGEPRKVKDVKAGLCEYHLAKGAETPRPAPVLPDRLPLVRRVPTPPARSAQTHAVQPIEQKSAPQLERNVELAVIEPGITLDPIRSAGYDPKIALLPPRTIRVLELLAEGHLNTEMAEMISVKINDVGMIVCRLYKHLEIPESSGGNRDEREGARRRRLAEKYLQHKKVCELFSSGSGSPAPAEPPASDAPISQAVLTEDDIQKWVGVRIRRRRTVLGLTSRQLGDATNLSVAQIQHYERGDYLSAGRLLLIAQALGVPVAYFYAGIEHPGYNGKEEEDLTAATRKRREKNVLDKLTAAVKEVRSILDSE